MTGLTQNFAAQHAFANFNAGMEILNKELLTYLYRHGVKFLVVHKTQPSFNDGDSIYDDVYAGVHGLHHDLWAVLPKAWENFKSESEANEFYDTVRDRCYRISEPFFSNFGAEDGFDWCVGFTAYAKEGDEISSYEESLGRSSRQINYIMHNGHKLVVNKEKCEIVKFLDKHGIGWAESDLKLEENPSVPFIRNLYTNNLYIIDIGVDKDGSGNFSIRDSIYVDG